MPEDTVTIIQEFTKPEHATFKCDCGEFELEESEVHAGYAASMLHIKLYHDGKGGVQSNRQAF